MSDAASRAALVGTNGATFYDLAVGGGRVVRLEFPASTIALRIRRYPDRITAERTEDVETWLVLGEWGAKPVAWSTIDELTGGDAPG